MKRPGFLEGAGLALLLAFAGALTYRALDWVLPGVDALRLVVSGLGLAYMLYLLGRSRERTGRVTTLALWLALTGLMWVLPLPMSLYLSANLAMVWATRSLYFHQGLPGALADLGLTGLGLIGALGAYLHTGSLFLSLWCLFLVQALFAFVPSRTHPGSGSPSGDEDRFRRAHQAAQTAIHRLSSIQ